MQQQLQQRPKEGKLDQKEEEKWNPKTYSQLKKTTGTDR